MSEHDVELKKLFPKLTPDELAAAEELLDAYLLLAWDISEEHSARPVNTPLTHLGPGSTIQVKVDSPTTN